MAFIKVLAFVALVAAAVAQQADQDVVYGDIPKYNFHYSVSDPNTGDQKAQEEERDGNNVRGFYTLVEPNGSIRRVDYTADEEHGFQAVVSTQPGAAAPIVQRTVAVAQPAVHVVHQQAPATIVHSAPVATVHHAPLTTYQQPIIHHAPLTTYQQYQQPIVQAYHAPLTSQIVHQAPLSTQVLHSAPVTSQIVHHAPLVSSVPQYITRNVAGSPLLSNRVIAY